MKGRSEWNWLPPPDEGIWRHGAAWMRPFAVSAPWITLAILMGLMALSDRRFTAASGVALDLPSVAVRDADVAGLVALVLPLAREVGGGEETFVFFDDARFTLSDPSSAAAFRRSLEERVASARHSALLLLADRRVPSGDLMNLTGLARSAGVRRVQIAEKRD